MEDIDYIGANELIFNKDDKLGVYSGGFSIDSIMLKNGMSPITTLNSGSQEGGSNKVSDLFQNLVVPNWVLSYNMNGGTYKDHESDKDDSDIDDELHDKLLDLVKEKEPKFEKQNKNNNKKNKKTIKQTSSKKKGTKKQRIDKKIEAL